jgi:hypothetical protein
MVLSLFLLAPNTTEEREKVTAPLVVVEKASVDAARAVANRASDNFMAKEQLLFLPKRLFGFQRVLSILSMVKVVKRCE